MGRDEERKIFKLTSGRNKVAIYRNKLFDKLLHPKSWWYKGESPFRTSGCNCINVLLCWELTNIAWSFSTTTTFPVAPVSNMSMFRIAANFMGSEWVENHMLPQQCNTLSGWNHWQPELKGSEMLYINFNVMIFDYDDIWYIWHLYYMAVKSIWPLIFWCCNVQKDCHDIGDTSFHQTYWAVFRIKSAGDSSSCEFEWLQIIAVYSNYFWVYLCHNLGGFKSFLFSPLLGELIQLKFDGILCKEVTTTNQ